ncbi:MAG: hypothetical protein AAFO83_00570 [Cyanobacteria bacterium J06607_13]
MLDRMLQPNPRDRFASASAVLAEMTANSQPVVAAGTSPNLPISAAQPSVSAAAAPPRPAQKQSARPAPKRVAPPVSAPARPAQPFSLRRFLGNAAFSGVEGGLLAIASLSVLGTGLLGSGAWLIPLAVLGALQVGRVIEGVDLAIIVGATFGVVAFFRPLHSILGGTDLVSIVVIALMAGGAMVAIAVVFRLIFRLLSSIL